MNTRCLLLKLKGGLNRASNLLFLCNNMLIK